MAGGTSSLLIRTVSKGLDLILVFAAMELLPKAGWLVGLGYILISDGLMEGRSIGKKLTGLQTLGEGGAACSMRESILRNISIAFAIVLWKIPLLGWFLFPAVLGVEFVFLLGSNTGRRIGDEIAKTSVVDTTMERQEI